MVGSAVSTVGRANLNSSCHAGVKLPVPTQGRKATGFEILGERERVHFRHDDEAADIVVVVATDAIAVSIQGIAQHVSQPVADGCQPVCPCGQHPGIDGKIGRQPGRVGR